MKILIFSCWTLLVSWQAHANPSPYSEGTSWISSLSLISTSEYTNYYAQQVQDDAAAYIATEGKITGPIMEKAIQESQEFHRDRNLSNIDIANNLLIGSLDSSVE